MGPIERIKHRIFNIRERKPDLNFVESEEKATKDGGETDVTVVGYSKEVASASKGVFSDAADEKADGGSEDAATSFPSEGKMTDNEASVLLDMVTEEQKEPVVEDVDADADEADDKEDDGDDSEAPVIDEDELLPADDSVPNPYGNLMGIKVDEDGHRYAAYDVRARANMIVEPVDALEETAPKEVVPAPSDAGDDCTDEEPDEEEATPADSDGHDADDSDEQPTENADDAEEETEAAPDETEEQNASPVSFRDGDAIEPIGFDAPFNATNATGEMLTKWHLRLVYDHEMPSGDDEPIVELYDGETGEFVSDYWVSQFCDNSDEREGQGLACKGAVKRYRIMYDNLVGMQELVRSVEAVGKWYETHKDDMPDHSI